MARVYYVRTEYQVRGNYGLHKKGWKVTNCTKINARLSSVSASFHEATTFLEKNCVYSTLRYKTVGMVRILYTDIL